MERTRPARVRRLVRVSLLALGTAVVLCGVALLSVWLLRRPPASRIFVNGVVRTLDARDTVGQGIALARDRIVAVGSDEDVLRHAGRGSIVVDLEGKTVLPGFIEAHGHFPASGLSAIGVNLASPPIGRIGSIAEAIPALRAKADLLQAGEWVIGYGYDDMRLAERRHFSRDDLSRVSRDHPVFVWHVSGHTAVVNDVALARLGIGRDTPNPPGGDIHKDPVTVEPTGRLDETALNEARGQALAFSAWNGLRTTREAVTEYAAVGVTTAQAGLADEKMFRSLYWLSRLGVVPLRIVVWPDAALADRLVRGELRREDFESDTFKIGAVKLIADGSIYIYTAYLTEPYATPYQGDAEYRAYPTHERPALAGLVRRFHEAGLQIAIHANGDAAIDDVLAALDQTQEAHARDDARHVIVHAQMTRPDQLDAMARLGVSPTFHNPHTFFFADRHWEVFLGPERTAKISPLASARARGVRFSLHNDAPVMPIDPLMAVWCAVHRRSAAGREIGPAERISTVAALRGVTIDAAWQAFEEDSRGSLEPGKLADLVILSGDPVAAPDRIREIQVMETIVGGRTVHRAAPE